jgi:hypothetical protein
MLPYIQVIETNKNSGFFFDTDFRTIEQVSHIALIRKIISSPTDPSRG